MTTVEIHDLWKTWDDFSAIRGANLTVREGEFLTLLGESGCGKTTTLRCIAGLETPTSGRIRFGGRDVFDSTKQVNTPPEKRNLGMVFQSYALWPHLTVQENVAFPLRSQRMKRAAAQEKSRAALSLVGLEHLADQSATKASGGQQQRVAVARAIVSDPAVMLYDEPLSNLDPSLRRSMRDSILDLHRKGETTSIYVTHDLEEAMHLSDRVVVMQNGLLEQVDAPQRIYTFPRTSYVAAFVGFENLIPVRVEPMVGDLAHVYLPALDIHLDVPWPEGYDATVDHLLAVRALHARLIPWRRDEEQVRSPHLAEGTISRVSYLGARTEYLVEAGGMTIKAALGERDYLQHGSSLLPGTRVWIDLDISMCRLVEVSPAHESLPTPVSLSQDTPSTGDAAPVGTADVLSQGAGV